MGFLFEGFSLMEFKIIIFHKIMSKLCFKLIFFNFFLLIGVKECVFGFSQKSQKYLHAYK